MSKTAVGTRTSSGWVLGRVGGVPVVLAPSWLLVSAVLVLIYYPFVRNLVPGGRATVVLVTVAFVVMLFISVLAHELAHGLSAQSVGVRPREYVITFWGGHTSFDNPKVGPGGWAFISVAGPLANVVLAVVSWFGARADAVPLVLAVVLLGSVYANGFVAAFNLLPGLPLDGGGILQALVWKITGDRAKGTLVAAWAGRVVVVGVVGWFLLVPLLGGRQPNLSLVIWVALIGSFLWMGAGQALRRATVERAARWVDLRALVVPTVVVDAGTPVAQVGQLLGGRSAVVVLVDGGTPVALVDPAAAAQVPAAEQATTPASAVARALDPAQIMAPLTGADALAAVAAAQQHGPVVVLHDGTYVVGAVPVAAVAKVVST